MIGRMLALGVQRAGQLITFAVAVVVLATGCDPLPDTFAIRNATPDDLTVSIETNKPFGSDDCDSHEGHVELGFGGEVVAAPGRRRCFQRDDGPGDSSDARRFVVRIRILRNGVACIDESGEDLMLRPFIDEGYHDTLIVDDALCP